MISKHGYTYYGTNYLNACASSPCANGGTCQELCLGGPGFKCSCVEWRTGDKCQNWTDTAQDYEIAYGKESTTDYLESEMNQTLAQFTFCLWVNVTSSGWSTLFSHVTTDNNEELMFRCQDMMCCQLRLIIDSKWFHVVPFNDGMWHQICMSWENGQGQWDVLIDGVMAAHGSAWHQALNLRPVPENEFMLNFPARENSSYVETTIPQPLKKMTISFWMKRDYDGSLSSTFMSYATTQHVQSLIIQLGDNGGFNMYILGDNPNHFFLMPTTDNLWHHLCVTWSNDDGKSLLFFDGVLIKSFSGFRINYTIPSGGILRIGQLQRVLGKDHNPSQMYHGKLKQVNIWSFVLNDSSITMLAKRPGTENGDVVSWRSMRRLTHGNVTIQGAVNIQLTAQESDFDLVFPSKSTANYAVYDSMPSLTRLTACAWIRLTHVSANYIFTYASSTSSEAIGFGYHSTTNILYFNINAFDWRSRFVPSALHDNGWHHLSFTWTNVDGKLCPFVNGEPLQCITSYKTGQTIIGGGKFILGQEQDAYGGAFSAAQAFYGRMSRVNIWSYVVNTATIKEMAKGCGLWSGDAIAWFHFKSRTVGDVQIVKPSSCSLAVPTVQVKRDAYCQSRYSSNPKPNCGTTLRAVFDRKHSQVGKLWRCFYHVALTEDLLSLLYVYDTGKKSTCLHSIEEELLALNAGY